MLSTPRSARQRTDELFRILLCVFGAQAIALGWRHFTDHPAGSPLSIPLFHGSDFTIFFDGARAWLAGQDPYAVNGFVTPPLSLVLPALLSRFSQERATLVFLICNLAILAVALWLYSKPRMAKREQVLFLLVATLFLPAQWCVHGGNMDGLMLVLLMAAFSARQTTGRALLLAASVGLKLYSIILLPVFLRRRQWRDAFFTVGALLLILLPFHHLWPSALHALSSRGNRFGYGSISPSAIVYALGGIRPVVYKGIGLAFWLITFCWALYRDEERSSSSATLTRYVPWMFAWPALVFPYVGVLALLVLASLMETAQRRSLNRSEYTCFLGFLLLGIHLDRIVIQMPVTQLSDIVCHCIQPFGVVLMMLGTCLGTRTKHEGERPDERREEVALVCNTVPD
jgi:hypothetical protein